MNLESYKMEKHDYSNNEYYQMIQQAEKRAIKKPNNKHLGKGVLTGDKYTKYKLLNAQIEDFLDWGGVY